MTVRFSYSVYDPDRGYCRPVSGVKNRWCYADLKDGRRSMPEGTGIWVEVSMKNDMRDYYNYLLSLPRMEHVFPAKQERELGYFVNVSDYWVSKSAFLNTLSLLRFGTPSGYSGSHFSWIKAKELTGGDLDLAFMLMWMLGPSGNSISRSEVWPPLYGFDGDDTPCASHALRPYDIANWYVNESIRPISQVVAANKGGRRDSSAERYTIASGYGGEDVSASTCLYGPGCWPKIPYRMLKWYNLGDTDIVTEYKDGVQKIKDIESWGAISTHVTNTVDPDNGTTWEKIVSDWLMPEVHKWIEELSKNPLVFNDVNEEKVAHG